jgi:hypothetical protein
MGWGKARVLFSTKIPVKKARCGAIMAPGHHSIF